MKKLSSLLLVAALLLSLFGMTVSAAGATISASSATTNPGGTVTITATLSGNPGIAALIISPKCDHAGITLTSSAGGNIGGFNVTTGTNIVFDAAANVTGNGTLATATFKVGSDVKPGSYEVYFTVRSASNADMEPISISTVKGTIKVECATHNWSAWSQTSAPGCTSSGEEKRTCTACGAPETRPISAKGHSWGSWAQTGAPGCTTQGQETRTCGTCNTPETRPVSAKGHSWGGWSQTSAPKCTTPGQEKRVCTTCSTPETRSITATGHSWGGWAQSKAPGCTTTGEQKRTCTTCNHAETKAIAATGHAFSNPAVTKAPTCTETGTETGTCTTCGQTTSNTLAALGHQYGSWSNEKAATCTEAGTQKRTCSACQDVENRTVAALGHDFEDPTIVTEPTLTSTGLMEGKCKNCGETTQQVIPCTAADSATGVTVEAEAGVFTEGTQTAFSTVTNSDAGYEGVKNAIAEVGDTFQAYTIDFTTAPNGVFTLRLPNTDGVAEEDLVVMLIAADGTAAEVAFTLDGTEIVVAEGKVGTYAVINKAAHDTQADAQAPIDDEPTKANLGWIWIVVGVAVVGVAAVVVFIILKDKKKD